MKVRLTAAILVCLYACCLSCSGISPQTEVPLDNCLDREIDRIRNLPERQYLLTLDGQRVPLDAFFTQCLILWPNCALYRKFYHWKNKTLQISSQSEHGPVIHLIRAYFNPVSTCFPDDTNPGKTHGDVAEFYDADGAFMGLGVYMGQGLYVPLPYSGYPKPNLQLTPLSNTKFVMLAGLD